MASALPDDIIFQEILIRRLPLKSLARWRCVCMSWNFVISDPDFMQPHLNRSISQNPDDDYLIRTWPGGVAILSRADLRESPVDNIPYNVPCIDHVRLVGSINGLVCLARISEPNIRFILWNPAIHLSKEIPLPEHHCSYPTQQHFYRLGFSWDSVTNDFKLIAIYWLRRSSTYIHSPSGAVYSSKTNSWSDIAINPPVVEPDRYPSVIVKGIPYWRCFSHAVILQFEARNNEFTYLPVSKDVGKSYNLVNLNDCLARIDFERNGKTDSIDVYQFDKDDNGWCKMFTVDFKENSIYSGPTCFKYGGEIVFNGIFSSSSASESNKMKHLSYEINRYYDLHGQSYTPSLVVLEGMEPLHLLRGGDEISSSPRTTNPEDFGHLEHSIRRVTTILVGKPIPNRCHRIF